MEIHIMIIQILRIACFIIFYNTFLLRYLYFSISFKIYKKGNKQIVYIPNIQTEGPLQTLKIRLH